MYLISTNIEQDEYGQDSLSTFVNSDEVYFCLADGSGGISGGKEASLFATSLVNIAKTEKFNSPDEFEAFLLSLDATISSDSILGETTIIVGKVSNNEVFGASVGDSECWILSNEFDYELSSHQIRKPLLGSGNSKPIGFGPINFSGTLLVASDGLFKYAVLSDIKELAHSNHLPQAIDYTRLAQLKSGTYSDDIAVIAISAL
ncbi:hypothetical protein CWC22_005050 [Pseudoalteromonas rubra]|uniref:Uncharacterized protein n=1 Tax=Pseudoalteromonas rubra TaxID=43658 RepID=A0A5S3UTG4_9GAMM|nr:hypothetical protein [Pseudoalteromonas rubra]QPB82386.1 hypothetical protein CWC22_005050 [Pseudoalteromonas rubra]